jgi:protein pelota
MGTVSNILDNIMKQVSKGERKFAMGFKDISYAHSINAVDSIVYSDKVFAEVDEAEFIRFLNDLENKNVKIFATDSTTDMGLRVSSLSGVVALLRYQIN